MPEKSQQQQQQDYAQLKDNLDTASAILALAARLKIAEDKIAEYEKDRKDAVKWAIGTLLLALATMGAYIFHSIPGMGGGGK
jgi:hypothetical protein